MAHQKQQKNKKEAKPSQAKLGWLIVLPHTTFDTP